MTPPNESSGARAERAKKRRKVQREEKDRLEKAMIVIGTCYKRPDLYLEGDAEHKRVAKAVIAAANALQSYSTPSPPPFEPPPSSSSSSSSSSASSSDGPTSITSLMSVDNDLADGLSRGGEKLADALRMAAASGLPVVRLEPLAIWRDLSELLELQQLA